MKAVGNTDVTLNGSRGEAGLVVIFSCNTCPWVKAWEDRYVTLADAFIPKGFGVIAINSNAASRSRGENFDDMTAHAHENGYNFTYALDGGARLATEFGASRTPHVFVFDAEGTLVYRGAIDDNANQPDQVEDEYLADALSAMLAGQKIVQHSTKALGCAIKFPR
ncbi:MAG: redoxin family protein [Candidatus Marinimicrobia bacterium]|nr:redoxin family protein [Candidatus Neomarinimicrobiota bacterium]